ncbi:autotransporter outer membrane beta-barrel domain-containing protein [Fusobacterium varium]|uniref:autotransporter family protein n=2 Tax=Fusobacterium TaxID=848 RepID=UPI002430A0E8|nr:autotransporter outer membrane beta-barrel domain-containing protein [Fusobacterium varium]
MRKNYKLLNRKIEVTKALLVLLLIAGRTAYTYEIEAGSKVWNFDGFLNEIVNNSEAKADIKNEGTITNKTATILLNSGKIDSKVNKIGNKGIMMADAAGVINNSQTVMDSLAFENMTYFIGEVNNEGRMEAKNITAQNYTGNGSIINNSLRLLNGNNRSGEYIVETGPVYNKGNMSGITRTGSEAGGTGNGINNSLSILYSKLSKASLKKLDNSGIIEGGNVSRITNNFEEYGNVGNGVLSGSTSGQGNVNATVGIVNNKGMIRGYNEGFGSSNGTNGGNGIAAIIVDTFDLTPSLNEKAEIRKVTNSGIIMGTNTAIAAFTANKTGNRYNEVKGTIDTIDNYGIFAGQSIINANVTNENNLGTYIVFDTKTSTLGKLSSELKRDLNGKVMLKEITIGAGGNATIDNINYNILNGNTLGQISSGETVIGNLDTYLNASSLTKNSNLIINGVGKEGALRVDKETSLENTIINGYEIALKMEDGNSFKGTNIVFNGGGIGTIHDNGTTGSIKDDYLEFINVIEGDIGRNEITLNGDSIINGNLDLKEGNDKLTLANTVQINGNLDGGSGNDILNLGEISVAKASSNLNILHDIAGFENINANGNITLFEMANVTGADDITLESGNLVLRVNPTVTADGKVTGHALYGNNGTLTSTGGNLVVGLNGLGEGAIISMGGTTITPNTDDSWWKDTDHIKTNSLVLDGKLSEDGKDINITVLESIPLDPSIPIPPIDSPVDPPVNPPIIIDSLLYEKLNKVYQSIVGAGEIGKLANTTLLEDKTYNESLGNLLVILNQIYANTPYSYSIKASRDSMKVFEDNMSYFTIKPNKGEWIVQGKGIYTGVKRDNVSSGKNYYGFDIGSINNKTTTSINGGLATAEYGISNVSSIGFVIGGNHQNTNFKGDNSLKGNSMYLGIFGKKEFNNLKLMTGAGYQYTSVDAERNAANNYDYFKTGDKYNVNGFNLFAEGKYEYNIENNWSIAPKIKLSYYHIIQENINEGYKSEELSMSVSRAKNDLIDMEIGIDLIKTINIEEGKLKGIISLGIVQSLGDKERELTGKIQGKNKRGSNFDIQGAEVPKTSGKASLNIEYEKTNGLIYTAGTEVEFSKDYNRNISVKLGLGYRF